MTQIRKISMTGFTVLMLLISAIALADEPVLTGVPISAADDSPGNLFGGSVSVSGDYALVGASGNSAAYVFVKDGITWSQQAKLTVQGEVTDFGWPVSTDGDYALVGALHAAYIFARDGDNWSQQAKLVPDNDKSESFAYTVALSGDYALVGDISDSGFAGSVYVFRRNGNSWEQQTKLTGSDTRENDMFGSSLAFSGDYAVIGAYDSDSGTAYLFQPGESSWTEIFRRSGGSYFAEAVGISDSGDYVIISNDASSPVILKNTLSGWEDQDTAGISSFSAVSISGDNACAVSRWTSRAYLIKRYDTPQADEWELYHPGEVEGFGASVSVSGDYCIVGADNSDSQERGGVAYIYDLTQFQGDANADKSVSLADAVLCMKIAAGISDQSVTKLADVDGNGQIGLEEAVFVLERLAK